MFQLHCAAISLVIAFKYLFQFWIDLRRRKISQLGTTLDTYMTSCWHLSCLSFVAFLSWRFVRDPGNVISSFFLCPFSSSSPLLQYPIQNLCIPKIAAHCELYNNHSPLRQGSASQHPSLFSKVMATEISFHLFFLLFSTGFDCFLCFYFYFSPTSLLFQTCDLPAAKIRKVYRICCEENRKSKQTVGKPLKCTKLLKCFCGCYTPWNLPFRSKNS